MSSNAYDIPNLKLEILKLGAALNRGESYNPTSGPYYEERMNLAKSKIADVCKTTKSYPSSLKEIEGDWELVITTVPHGIFRSSPFFLAIQEAYAVVNQTDKANLFFKLHELQTCSWGISKVGRVAQTIDSVNGQLISEFDTSIFALTVFPIIGWGNMIFLYNMVEIAKFDFICVGKLLPTFGGRVVTVAKASFSTINAGQLDMEVDYTTAKEIPGLNGLSSALWDFKVPVGAIWRLLPWNNGRSATCKVFIRYLDEDFRIVEDIDGEFFVYTRPITK